MARSSINSQKGTAHQIGFTKLFIPEAPGEGTPDNISKMMIAERLCKSPSAAIVLIGPGLPLAAIMRAGSADLQTEIMTAMDLIRRQGLLLP